MQRATRTQAIVAGLAGATMIAAWAMTANAQSPAPARLPTPAPVAAQAEPVRDTAKPTAPARVVRVILPYGA